MQTIKSYSVVNIGASSEAVSATQSVECEDLVVVEEPLEIWFSCYSRSSSGSYLKTSPELLFTTMRTPGDDINLVKGWLYSSGAIQDFSKIESITHVGTGRLKSQTTNRVQINLTAEANIDLSDYQRAELMNSACGVCGQQSIENILDKLPQIPASDIPLPLLPISAVGWLTQQLRDKQVLFEQTGGNHGAALFNQELQLVDVREDVGRHNAFDKLLGANLHRMATAPHETESIMGVVLSSRASFDLVQKAAMVNIRFIIALGAPSSLAIDLAKDCDICLLGFVKTSESKIKFNVYSSPHMLA
ncbi:MAG: formate dehydrogenase accessory sulfurtransferase FdhD [Paraglaciecola sp.]|uniref:formate dehydrogenase accessory sulfurtransferase FdhD n=1 Tax=Paraglaciecola sp. TaxID=1920173 RepID=UPI003297949E